MARILGVWSGFATVGPTTPAKNPVFHPTFSPPEVNEKILFGGYLAPGVLPPGVPGSRTVLGGPGAPPVAGG